MLLGRRFLQAGDSRSRGVQQSQITEGLLSVRGGSDYHRAHPGVFVFVSACLCMYLYVCVCVFCTAHTTLHSGAVVSFVGVYLLKCRTQSRNPAV